MYYAYALILYSFYMKAGGAMQVEIGTLIGLLVGMSGVVFGYLNYKRFCKKDIAEESIDSGELKADINYIRRGVEDIRIDMKAQEKRFGELTERVARVEERAKSAHHRIDGIESKRREE